MVRDLPRGHWLLPWRFFRGVLGGVYRVVALLGEPSSAGAIVRAIREVELAGGRVVRVGGGPGSPTAVVLAADLVVRLREVSAALAEEDVLTLLELLPL